MQAASRRPLSVAFCTLVVRVAACLIPVEEREDWQQEWIAKIWHRWQFLFHNGEWNRREQLRLVRESFDAFFEAGWRLASQEDVQKRVRECVRSPWTCLLALIAALAACVVFTGGAPATKQLAGPYGQASADRLVLIWLQPLGRRPVGLPADVVPDWRKDKPSVVAISRFIVRETKVQLTGGAAPLPYRVVHTDAELFDVLQTRPMMGTLQGSDFAAIDFQTWVRTFHRDPTVLNKYVVVAGVQHRVSAVLPSSFQFLSREPSVYVVGPFAYRDRPMAIARMKNGVGSSRLIKEFTRIARDVDYYNYSADPRLKTVAVRDILFMPIWLFMLAAVIAAFLTLCLSRVRLRHIRHALARGHRSDALRRGAFFAAKLGLALSIVFITGLEWTRPQSSLLLTWSDGGSGLGIVWVYVFGSMAAFFGVVADQRARCRVCLRLLGFPVRIGVPGRVLLDWSGTELLCSEGHGVLHVPHLATSWDEEADRWISLDDSWRDFSDKSTT